MFWFCFSCVTVYFEYVFSVSFVISFSRHLYPPRHLGYDDLRILRVNAWQPRNIRRLVSEHLVLVRTVEHLLETDITKVTYDVGKTILDLISSIQCYFWVQNSVLRFRTWFQGLQRVQNPILGFRTRFQGLQLSFRVQGLQLGFRVYNSVLGFRTQFQGQIYSFMG